MSTVNFAADSTTLLINGYAFSSFLEGDFLTLTPVNPLTSHTNSATGVSINKRMDGDVFDLAFRVQKYSADDVQVNTWINSATPVVLNGSVKEQFNRDGSDFTESWSLEAGSITTRPTHTKNNQDGNNAVEYTMRFRRAKRSL